MDPKDPDSSKEAKGLYEFVPGAPDASVRCSSRDSSLPPYKYYDIKEYYEGSFKPAKISDDQALKEDETKLRSRGLSDTSAPISQNDARLLRIEHLAEVGTVGYEQTK